ncbi:hypothetical protein AB9P05_00015 [Roseivirga sp. BDSF3-8]|uniref:hypothetical protein n=1 Tax=Roseivirga sp. BDSF3-8 TaxID=3241598 RepID=UPI00353189D2
MKIKTIQRASRFAIICGILSIRFLVPFLFMGLHIAGVTVSEPIYSSLLTFFIIGILSGLILLTINFNLWPVEMIYKFDGELQFKDDCIYAHGKQHKLTKDTKIHALNIFLPNENLGESVTNGGENSISLVRKDVVVVEINFLLEDSEQQAYVSFHLRRLSDSGYSVLNEPYIPVIRKFR